jgi:hypothetical protein
MPFTFDYTACKGEPQVHPMSKTHWHPVAAAINQMALFLGYTTITEENVAELARRFSMYQRVQGPLIRWDDPAKKAGDHHAGQAYIVEDDLRLFIGYRCNASSKKPKEWDADFVKFVAEDPVSNWQVGLRGTPPSAHAKYGEFAKRHKAK